jgi:hypothetical protein
MRGVNKVNYFEDVKLSSLFFTGLLTVFPTNWSVITNWTVQMELMRSTALEFMDQMQSELFI